MRYEICSAFHKTDPLTTMALKRTTAPTDTAVSTVEAKLHLRVDGSDEDTLISALVMAATEAAEQRTGRSLMPQRWTLTLDAFPCVVELTRVPVTSVVSVKYDDINGVEQTLAVDQYVLHNADEYGVAKITPAYGLTWPSTRAAPGAVRIEFAAGYANAAAVPAAIKSWIQLMIGAMYTNREAEVVGNGGAISLGFADRLLDRYRVY